MLPFQCALQRAVADEEKVKAAQADEMQEVENYVEHIRSLSDERETLIQELETENEQLRVQVDKLKQQGAGTRGHGVTESGRVNTCCVSFTGIGES